MPRKPSSSAVRTSAPAQPPEELTPIDADTTDTIADPVFEEEVKETFLEDVLTIVDRPTWSVTVGVRTGAVMLWRNGFHLELGHIDMDMTALTETQIRSYAADVFQRFYSDLRG